MKFHKERLDQIRSSTMKRTETQGPTFLKAVTRVDLVHEEDMKHQLKVDDFVFYSDEPKERGGSNAGPSPLSYFIGGALACLINQYVRLAVIEGVEIEDLEATVRGHFERKVVRAFTHIFYDIRIKSTEDADRIKMLSKKAEASCYAHNTLKKAVEMTTNIYLNDQLL